MADTTADEVAAALAGIRERNERMRTRYGYVGGLLALAGAKEDVPRLLAALEAVLKEHRKTTVYALSVLASDTQELPRVWCGHTYEETENSRHQMCDDDTIVCLDKPEGDVCASCWEESGGEPVEWPCPTYAAISRELLGKDSA